MADVHTIDLSNVVTSADPTPQLRFVERNGQRILQQGWSKRIMDGNTGKIIGGGFEWIDVPLELED